MKLYIDNDGHWSGWLTPSVTQEELDEYHAEVKEWCDVADNLGCTHQVHYTNYGAEIIVFQQKCTLDEYHMNTLFDEFLTNMFDASLSYAHIGGSGCDFAIRAVLKKREKP